MFSKKKIIIRKIGKERKKKVWKQDYICVLTKPSQIKGDGGGGGD